MLAVDPRVVDAAWAAVEPLIPCHVAPSHPLGTHRQRIADRECFVGMLLRLVTGCSWFVASQLCEAGETTLRRRRNEWIEAGIFDDLAKIAMDLYDQEIGLAPEVCAMDGSLHKAPCGGEGTGKSPVDRGKLGWKWSIATEANGVPLGWATAGANRHDSMLFVPTLLDVFERGHLETVDSLHLDRGYDSAAIRQASVDMGIETTVIATKRKPGAAPEPPTISLGRRWTVERTNSWLSNFGQMRRNTDRHTVHRRAQLAFAVAMILFVKLFKHDLE